MTPPFLFHSSSNSLRVISAPGLLVKPHCVRLSSHISRSSFPAMRSKTPFGCISSCLATHSPSKWAYLETRETGMKLERRFQKENSLSNVAFFNFQMRKVSLARRAIKPWVVRHSSYVSADMLLQKINLFILAKRYRFCGGGIERKALLQL